MRPCLCACACPGYVGNSFPVAVCTHYLYLSVNSCSTIGLLFFEIFLACSRYSFGDGMRCETRWHSIVNSVSTAATERENRAGIESHLFLVMR